ncbi:MAG: hypothetical protein QXP70_05460 [Methanomassiliicoccales archaeon]
MNLIVERCPRCGKVSKLEKGEVVAYCPSCKSLHEPGKSSNVDVEIGKFSIVSDGERCYLPFWRFFCDFSVNSTGPEHRNVQNFIHNESSGRLFVYVPAADITPIQALQTGAYLTANSPSYSTTAGFGDVKRLVCAKGSDTARDEVDFYFLSAETSEGRASDLTGGFSVTPTAEKLVFIPFYRKGDGLTPGV